MRTKLLVAALVASACGAAAAPAGAGQIYIGLQDPLVNNGAITSYGPGSPSIRLDSQYGSFNFLITASDFTGSDLVSTANVSPLSSIPSAGDTLTVYVTELGLTAVGLSALFNSSLIEDALPSDVAVTELTGMDPHNQQFVTPSQLALATYSGQGSTVTSATEGVSGVYSVTERYFFSATGWSTNTVSAIGVKRAATSIPEPSTWAMLGIGFGGLALAGMFTRRRKDSRFAK